MFKISKTKLYSIFMLIAVILISLFLGEMQIQQLWEGLEVGKPEIMNPENLPPQAIDLNLDPKRGLDTQKFKEILGKNPDAIALTRQK
jgi:hypothetical protein